MSERKRKNICDRAGLSGRKISGKSTGQCDKPGLRKLGIVLLVRKSSDQSEKIARDYEKKYDSIHMIERGENKAGEARNQGLEKAQGEYVLFLDSDDYLPDASSCSVMSVWQSRQMRIL